MKPRSDVWKHFEKESKTEAVCKICKAVLKSCGNTSNLRSHLVKFHKMQKNNLNEPEMEKKKSPVKVKKSSLVKVEKSSVKPAKLKVRMFKTPKRHENKGVKSLKDAKNRVNSRDTCTTSVSQNDGMEDFISKVPSLESANIQVSSQPSTIASLYLKEKLPVSGSRQSITEKLLYFICKDYHPPSVVKGEGFKTLMKEVSPLYEMPCQRTIENLINEKFNSIKIFLKEKLTSIPFFSVTTNMWSHRNTFTNYLEVSVHFIDGTSLESIGLGVYELKDPPSAEYLGSEITNVLTEWGLPEEKIFSVVSDNESAVIKAVSDVFEMKRHLRCIAHSVKLVADASMETGGLDQLMEKVREIVLFFEGSTKASDELSNAVRLKNGNENARPGLILDVKTQWISSLCMIESFLLLSDVIRSILLENLEAPPMLTEKELDIIKEVKTILSMLEKLTTELSRELYASASGIIPLLNCFSQSLAKFDPKNNLSKNLLGVLLEEFESQFKDREQTLMLSIPMVLDPRFKTIYFMDSSASQITLNLLKKLLSEVEESEVLLESESEPRKEINFEMYHKSLANSSLKGMACPGDLDSELDLYLSTPVTANLRANPIDLWEDSKHVYPKLYFLAKKYLTTVAVSIPAENLFSKTRNAVSDERNQLEGELLPKILFLGNLPKKYWF